MIKFRLLLATAAAVLPLAPALAAEPGAVSARSSYAPLISAVYDAEAEVAHRHDDYYYDRYRRRNRVDAGDVIAGVIVIGTIAAILSSRNKSRDRDYRDRDYRGEDYRGRNESRDYRSRDYRRDRAGRGIDGAVELCIDEVEREARVESIDTARRDGSGWLVSGRLGNGDRFRCELGSDGRIRDIDIDRDRGISYRGDDDQGGNYDDDYYADARRDTGAMRPDVRGAPDDSRLRDWSFEGDDEQGGSDPGPDYALAN